MAYSLTSARWNNVSTSERWLIQTIWYIMRPFAPDTRITALLSLLANQLMETAENEAEIDNVLDFLRLQLKIEYHNTREVKDG